MRLKKRRGVFYTPARLAEVLAAWSIRSKSDLVLEPSFGGCGFIAALQRRFTDIGNKTPLKNIFGCDVDPTAFKRHLPDAIGVEFDKKHFRKADFLSLDSDAFPISNFSAVLGNPPYVSYHNMFRTQRVAAATVGTDREFRLSGMASLWAYFVFHSLKFVRENGRMAWLLPGSLLHANYSKELLHELARRFARVAVISLSERIFLDDGVSETTEILLCDGYHDAYFQRDVEVTQARNIDSCAAFLHLWHTRDWNGAVLNGRAIPALVGAKKLSIFEEISARTDVVKLDDLASISIGIVTGANRLFILNETAALEHRLSLTALKPILAKFSASPGIRLVPRDLLSAMGRGIPSLLVDGTKAKGCKAVRSYFAAVPKAFRKKNVTFGKHSDWRCPDDNRAPDAFFPYMHHTGPRLVLNHCGVNATNTIHRVYFKSDVNDVQRKLAVISLLSTFSQLSAEIEGRSYGAGVLKHEPGEAREIRLVLPELLSEQRITSLFKRIDSLLRQNLPGEAAALVDRELIAGMREPPSQKDWKSLRITLKQLRARRLRT
jgi:adenine-specific DNA methylase